jgi:hypothetical protein
MPVPNNRLRLVESDAALKSHACFHEAGGLFLSADCRPYLNRMIDIASAL